MVFKDSVDARGILKSSWTSTACQFKLRPGVEFECTTASQFADPGHMIYRSCAIRSFIWTHKILCSRAGNQKNWKKMWFFWPNICAYAFLLFLSMEIKIWNALAIEFWLQLGLARADLILEARRGARYFALQVRSLAILARYFALFRVILKFRVFPKIVALQIWRKRRLLLPKAGVHHMWGTQLQINGHWSHR